MATGDSVFSPAGQVTVITGAATRATGIFSVSGEVTPLSANTYQVGDATLSCTYTVAPSEGDLVNLFRRDINIDGTNDATIPEPGYGQIYVGSFVVKDTTSIQYCSLPEIPLFSGDQEFYIENAADQTMSTGYVVKVTPVPSNTE